MPIRVLIVEDEADIAALVKRALERHLRARVEVSERGDSGLEAATADSPDLIILDINLPGLNGFEICRILRARPETAHVPIICLTARTSESDAVSALDLGADDYITKPFRLREVVARVGAVMRRVEAGETAALGAGERYVGAGLVVDFDAVSASVDGRAVSLTRREFELLHTLVKNRNRVLTRDRLLECIWGLDTPVGTRSVDVHVARLRGKLGPAGELIETVTGVGYRFADRPAAVGEAPDVAGTRS